MGTVAAGASTASADASVRAVTYMFGRAQLGEYVPGTHCQRAIPGYVGLWTVADALRARGHAATAAVTLNWTRDTSPLCGGGIKYASWLDLARLRDTYGWSVVPRGRTGKDITTMTRAQQLDETCGTLPDLEARGFHDGWGMYAYAGNNLSPSLQATVASCFAFGRRYSIGRNALPIASPYFARTNSVNGGRCGNASLPCYSMAVKNNRRYTSPDALITYENATGWTIIQWYRLVVGSRGRTGSAEPAWDCTSTNWRNHWTNRPEVYCYDDAMRVVDGLAPGSLDASPAELGILQGRDFSSR